MCACQLLIASCSVPSPADCSRGRGGLPLWQWWGWRSCKWWWWGGCWWCCLPWWRSPATSTTTVSSHPVTITCSGVLSFFSNILTFVQNRAVFIRLLCTFCPNVNFYQCYLFLEEDPARSSQPQRRLALSQKSESSHRFGLFGCPLPRYGRPLALVGWTTLSRWLFTSQKVPPSEFQISARSPSSLLLRVSASVFAVPVCSASF